MRWAVGLLLVSTAVLKAVELVTQPATLLAIPWRTILVIALHTHAGLHARLPDDREWFAQTPVEIKLADGVVVDASTDLPSLAATAER